MKVVVIGGSGHIGTYLVPILVNAGYNVINISRGQSKPYIEDPSWKKVQSLILDRDKETNFAEKVSSLNADIVIDLISFKIEDTKSIVEQLRKTNIHHYLFCSSIWAHGRATYLPLNPNDPNKSPLDEYGKNKFQSELYLKEQYKQNGFPATIIMPGQICGPYWDIINPYGHIDHLVFQKVADGEKLFLPNFGMETLHHVHAEDVADMFFQAINYRDACLGESFHAVSTRSITLYGYTQLVFEFFEKEENVEFLPWKEWCERIGDSKKCDATYLHIARSGSFSIENAQRILGYGPRHTIEETIKIAIQGYIDRGLVTIKK